MTRYIFSFICFLFFACSEKPKVIVADAPAENRMDSNAGSMGSMNPGNIANAPGIDNSVHRVVTEEVLQADRYTYLHVNENNRKFWIATSKFDAKKGKVYLYRGGLLKTNFESQEYKRNFDTLYLVSGILDENQHPGGNLPAGNQSAATTADAGHQHHTDAVKIADIFSNKKKFEGKEIIVEGQCIKVNNGIMGRNWVHVQDGSKHEGKPAEITITTQDMVNQGQHVALRGKVVLNKDFGAGYRYEIILEEGRVL